MMTSIIIEDVRTYNQRCVIYADHRLLYKTKERQTMDFEFEEFDST